VGARQLLSRQYVRFAVARRGAQFLNCRLTEFVPTSAEISGAPLTLTAAPIWRRYMGTSTYYERNFSTSTCRLGIQSPFSNNFPGRSFSHHAIDSNCEAVSYTNNEQHVLESLSAKQRKRITYLKQLHHETSRSMDSKDEEVVVDKILVQLGDFYFQLMPPSTSAPGVAAGFLACAQDMYEEALQNLIKRHGRQGKNRIMASVLHKLGSLHAKQSQLAALAMATQETTDADEADNPSVPDQKDLQEESMKWYGASLSMKQELLSDMAMLDGACTKEEGIEDVPLQVEIGMTLNGIAMIHAQRGEIHESAMAFRRAVDMSSMSSVSFNDDHTLGQATVEQLSHPYRSVIYENMALLLLSTRDFEEALTSLEEAVKILIRQKHQDRTSNQDTGTGTVLPGASYTAEHHLGLLIKISSCHRGLRDQNRAKEVNENALQILKVAYRKIEEEGNKEHDHDDQALLMRLEEKEAVIRHEYGMILAQVSQFNEALEEFDTSLELKKRLLCSDKNDALHPEIAETLNMMGAVYGSLDDPHKARSYFREALRIYQAVEPWDEEGNEHANVISVKQNISLVQGAIAEGDKQKKF
jgi:tetratricopeptide (TPR) repeat protein